MLPVSTELDFLGIFPENHSFQGRERQICFKLAYSAELKKYIYLSKDNQLC
jgi:hypothetical protein